MTAHLMKRLVLIGGALVLSLASMGLPAATAGASPRSKTVPKHEMKRLKKAIHKAEKVPRFVAPGPKIKGKAAKGDTVVEVPNSSAIPYCSGTAKDIQKIGKKFGIKVTDYTASGEPSQWQAAATLAASQHASAFDMICGITPGSLAPQLAKLKAEKIPTVDTLGDTALTVPSSITAGNAIQLDKAARLLVDDSVVQNHGKPFHTLILTDYTIFGAHTPTNAAEKHLKKLCGSSCPYTVHSIPTTTWASDSSTVSGYLNADPTITSVIAVYDGAVPGMMSAISGAHRKGLHVYTYGGSKGVVTLIKTTHGLVAADAGASTPWTAYSIMDQVLRVLTGHKPVPYKKDHPPLRLWSPKNVSQFNSPKKSYGKAFEKDFDKLWGLKS